MIAYPDVDALAERIGAEAGRSGWHAIDQARIDAFAEITGDRQWIHVDPARCRDHSPYKTTIAHGFLTASLLVPCIEEAIFVASARLSVNYGFDKLRFLAPVPVDSQIRAIFIVAGIERKDTVARVAWDVSVEIRGSAKPALAGVWISQIYE